MVIPKHNRYDKIKVGWLIGIIGPLLIFLLTYQIEFSDAAFSSWIRNIWNMKIMMKLLSLCVVPNLGFFMFFYKKKFDMAARGVILATFMYAFVVLLVKLL